MKPSTTLITQALTASAAAHQTHNSTYTNPVLPGSHQLHNSTYTNPVLPGWNPDPSCLHVDGTFFCATSTFLAAPGLPIYASKDLTTWKLASNVWTRSDQFPVPNAGRDVDNLQGGFYAPNLRHRDGVFYMTNLYVDGHGGPGVAGVGTIFTTTDPFDSASWSDALAWNASRIDPELFWDRDGSTYLVSQGIILQEIDLSTGVVDPPVSIWNGTGGPASEGPHLLIKDDWYYLIIAEGGTAPGHSVTIARSKELYGPYESAPMNPFLTAADTENYFQTVGHVDLFTDSNDHWWAVGLATRRGPDWLYHPMGRETFLTPVTWDEGEWPVFSPVYGVMNGWELPASSRDVPGEGHFVEDPDNLDFAPGTSLPPHLVHFRFPEEGTFTVSPDAHPNTLHIRASRTNLTGALNSPDTALTGKTGLPFAGRRQSHTLFTFSVDLTFSPLEQDQEAGISAFLTQHQHIDLGITLSNSSSANALSYDFAFRIVEIGAYPYGRATALFPDRDVTVRSPVPSGWVEAGPVTLEVRAVNETHFAFSAFPAGNKNARVVVGYAPVTVVGVGYRIGQFLGTLLGAYATCHGAGGEGTLCPGGADAYFSDWRYKGVAQMVGEGEFVF